MVASAEAQGTMAPVSSLQRRMMGVWEEREEEETFEARAADQMSWGWSC